MNDTIIDSAMGCVPEKGQEGDCHWAERCSVNAIVLSPSDSHLARENLGRTRAMRDAVTAKPPSQLFTVRIWPELSDRGMVAWRGKVQHVPNGAWRYFQDGDGLIAFLQSQVEEFVR